MSQAPSAPDWAPSAFAKDILQLLERRGRVFARFDRQDSGNLAYGLEVDGTRWFVKVMAPEHAPSLGRVRRLHQAVAHPALIPLLRVVPATETAVGIYPWVAGELLYPAAGAAQERFRELPVPEILAALGQLFALHQQVTEAGHVSVDFYDGCLLYDFDQHALHVCDLDEYRRAPFVLKDKRLPGSKRYMAPEEFLRGSSIDQRTTVFHMGRTAQILLRAPCSTWRGGSARAAVLARATRAHPRDRHQSLAAFVEAFEACNNATR